MQRDAFWLDAAVGYEVYIRSFADGDGDGVGDLRGLIDRLDHLAWLGVDVVWVTPFMPTPGADHGYDVADYCDVDPRFGTVADVEELVARAHDLGLRVLVDLVPNHSSSEHPWFVDALRGPDRPHRSWYHWADPAPDGGPPNNWVGHFGGSAWTFDETSGQYYLHLFLPEQPDLNWDEPAVRAAFDEILRFWLDHGVDGFRIDVAHALAKGDLTIDNVELRDELPGEDPRDAFARFEHLADIDQPGVLDIYRRWRSIADEYDAALLGEVYQPSERVARYLRDGDGLHQAFHFGLVDALWDPEALAASVASALDEVPGGMSWVLSSHDSPRAVSRFARRAPGDQSDLDAGRRRTLGFHALLTVLPGMAFLYQGEELALANGVVGTDAAHDPVVTRTEFDGEGRDVARTPLPWAPDGKHLGFSTAEETWLPMGPRTPADTVSVQRADPASWANAYRRLLAARHSFPRPLPAEAEISHDAAVGLLVVRRGPLLALQDADGGGVVVALGDGVWRCGWSSDHRRDISAALSGAIELQAEEAVILWRE